MSAPFSGVVLAGGASRRMGRDKALVEVGGRPMVVAATSALVAAGAAEVLVVGGDRGALRSLGLTVVADHHPGEGPLGGLVTALEAVAGDRVAVLSCDLLAPSSAAVCAVVRALDDAAEAAWAAPVAFGRGQFLHGAYRTAATPHWNTRFAAGERSLWRAAAGLPGVLVPGIDPAALADADEPGDLPAATGDRYAPGSQPTPAGGRPVDPQVPEIDVTTLAARRDVPLVDVREVDEYAEGHVPGARLLPMSEIADRVHEVPAGGEVFVICRSGGRSLRVAEHLRTQGIDAVNVAGGTLAWIEAGQPTASGLEPG